LAEAIFGQVEDVHILATSREALRIEGEHVYRAHEALASVIGRFAQGKETVDLGAAADLLDALA
jgi:predicted ATPase